jgi:hypothetical protein
MGMAKRGLQEDEDRRAAIESIGVDSKALVHDEISDEISSAEDEDATKEAYAKIFRDWADGKIAGTVDEVFEDAKSILES